MRTTWIENALQVGYESDRDMCAMTVTKNASGYVAGLHWRSGPRVTGHPRGNIADAIESLEDATLNDAIDDHLENSGL